MKYVKLVIDNKSDQTDRLYTYGCRDDQIAVGSKVYVPFARGNRKRGAYVFQVMDEPDIDTDQLKYVIEIDPEISLNEEMIETCRWMRDRYLCRYIDGVHQFLPAGSPSKRGRKRSPLDGWQGEEQNIRHLTEEQQAATEKIVETLSRNVPEIFLLHGITGSGKTEVYMQAIAACIKQGRTAIMLVPEISLTKQIIDRFTHRFGTENLAILHSKLSQGERYDEWKRIRSGEVKVVVGARSAVFAPLARIGLIILDEEHETTYKSDMTPKYETMEVAIKRSRWGNGLVVAGSATPSVVSYQRSEEGIYRRLELTRRYNQVPLPRVEVVDMEKELRQGNSSVFSTTLYDAMEDQLAAGKQVILFLNRRGYSTYALCPSCGHVIRCPECGISLTYHKGQEKMVCHYCGRRQELPACCPECGKSPMRYMGSGTEKVEEAAADLFSRYPSARLDLDVMQKKTALEKILTDFGSGKIRILTGTQVVAKGLDFPDVGLVGIISADVSLNIPDYRAPERAFQLITQAAGRAGRGQEPGRVIIQTHQPDHYAVEAASRQDYAAFFRQEIQLRKLMDYPPCSDLIQILISGRMKEAVEQTRDAWRERLQSMVGEDLAGAILSSGRTEMMKGKEIYQGDLLLKCLPGRRGRIMGAIRALKEEEKSRRKKIVELAVDVNPYSLWRN